MHLPLLLIILALGLLSIACHAAGDDDAPLSPARSDQRQRQQGMINGTAHLCKTCVRDGSYWCSLTNQCVTSRDQCVVWTWDNATRPDNVEELYQGEHALYWFFPWEQRKKSGGRKALMDAIPQHCRTGLVEQEIDCFDMEQVLQLSLVRSCPNESWNYINPLSQQPWLNMTIVDRNYLVGGGTAKKEDLLTEGIITIGTAFTRIPQDALEKQQKPLFFSYYYHVKGDNVASYDWESSQILQLKDLAISSRPGYFQLSFGILAHIHDPQTNVITYQCAFVPQEKDIYQHAAYESIYKGPHIFLGVPLLLLVITVMTIIFMTQSRHFRPDARDALQEEYIAEEIRNFSNAKRGGALKYSIREIFVSLFTSSDTKLIEQCGTDIYFYLWFQKMLIIFSMACGVLCMGALLPLYLTSTDYNHMYQDFAGATVAAIRLRYSGSTIAFIFITVMLPVLGYGFLWRVRNLARILVKGNKNYASLFTVMVSNIPSHIKDKRMLRQDFVNRYGANAIADSHICLDLGYLERMVNLRIKFEDRLAYYERIADRKKKQPTIRTNGYLFGLVGGKKVDAISFYKNRLAEIEPIIHEAKKYSNIKSSTYGFVTFTSIDAARICIRDHQMKLCGITIPMWCFDDTWNYRCKPAPEADDIEYDNLKYGSISRSFRLLTTNTVMLTTLLVVYAATFVASTFQYWRVQASSVINQWAHERGSLFIFNSLVDIVPAVIGIVQAIFPPVVNWVTQYEKHHTRDAFKISMVRKTSWYMILNTVFIGFLAMYWFGVWRVFLSADMPFDNYGYFVNTVGVNSFAMLLILMAIAKSGEWGIMTLEMLVRYMITKRLQRPRFDYESSYGFKITLLLFVMLFGSTVPLIFPVIIVFLVFHYWLEKFFIMFLFEKGSDSDGRVVSEVADISSAWISFFPLLLMFVFPNMWVLWQTYVIYFPFILLNVIVLLLLKRYGRRKLKRKIILGLEDHEEEEETLAEVDEDDEEEEEYRVLHNQNPDQEDDDDDSMSTNSISSALQENISANQDDTASEFSVSGTSSSHGRSSSAKRKMQSFGRHIKHQFVGKERRLTAQEIDNMYGGDVRSLAKRYEHPVIRTLRALRKREQAALPSELS